MGKYVRFSLRENDADIAALTSYAHYATFNAPSEYCQATEVGGTSEIKESSRSNPRDLLLMNQLQSGEDTFRSCSESSDIFGRLGRNWDHILYYLVVWMLWSFWLLIFVNSDLRTAADAIRLLAKHWFYFHLRGGCFYLHHSHTSACIPFFSHTAYDHLPHQLLLHTLPLIIMVNWLTSPWYKQPKFHFCTVKLSYFHVTALDTWTLAAIFFKNINRFYFAIFLYSLTDGEAWLCPGSLPSYDKTDT